MAADLAENGHIDGGGHRRMLSGSVVWCAVCGAYATERAKGLSLPCPGQPVRGSGGGRAQQRDALRSGRHPKSGEHIGPPCPEPGWAGAEAVAVTQAPMAVAVPAVPNGRFAAMRDRVRARIAARANLAAGEAAHAPLPAAMPRRRRRLWFKPNPDAASARGYG